MIRWHLVLAPSGVVQLLLRIIDTLIDLKPTCAGKSSVAVAVTRITKLLRTPVHELVDIAVVVGEQNEILKVLNPRAGVMRQARKRVVSPQAIKQ